MRRKLGREVIDIDGRIKLTPIAKKVWYAQKTHTLYISSEVAQTQEQAFKARAPIEIRKAFFGISNHDFLEMAVFHMRVESL